jgi:hypothetical protein
LCDFYLEIASQIEMEMAEVFYNEVTICDELLPKLQSFLPTVERLLI